MTKANSRKRNKSKHDSKRYNFKKLELIRKSKYEFSVKLIREEFVNMLNKTKFKNMSAQDLNKLRNDFKKISTTVNRLLIQRHNVSIIREFINSYFIEFLNKSLYTIKIKSEKVSCMKTLEALSSVLDSLILLEPEIISNSKKVKEIITLNNHNEKFINEIVTKKGKYYPNYDVDLLNLVDLKNVKANTYEFDMIRNDKEKLKILNSSELESYSIYVKNIRKVLNCQNAELNDSKSIKTNNSCCSEVSFNSHMNNCSARCFQTNFLLDTKDENQTQVNFTTLNLKENNEHFFDLTSSISGSLDCCNSNDVFSEDFISWKDSNENFTSDTIFGESRGCYSITSCPTFGDYDFLLDNLL